MSTEVELFTTSILGNPKIRARHERFVTVLGVQRIPYVYHDLASDEDAKRRWRRKALDPQIPGILVHNEWRGTFEDFEDAVEHGELDQFLRLDPSVKTAPSVEELTPMPQPAARGLPTGTALMPRMAAPGTGARDEPDADRMLAELLPQGTQVSDADVDALLQELEKPLKRTPRRTYQPSSSRSAAPPPMPLPRMPNAREAQGAFIERYDPQERNLVAEAARAIGVEPKPRAPVPRMALNRRPLHQVLEERRQRQARSEMDRANNELFATMGVEDLKLSDAEADAFLNEGIIPDTTGKKAPPVSAFTRAAEPSEKPEPEGHDTKAPTHEQAETVSAQEDATTKDITQGPEVAKKAPAEETKEAQPKDAEAKSVMQPGDARDEPATEGVSANDSEAAPAADAAAATKGEVVEPLKDDTARAEEANELQRKPEGTLMNERSDEPKVAEPLVADQSELSTNKTEALPAGDSHDVLTKLTQGGENAAEQAKESSGAEETRPSAAKEEPLDEKAIEPTAEGAETPAANESGLSAEGAEADPEEVSLVDLSEDTRKPPADDKLKDKTRDEVILAPLLDERSEEDPSKAAAFVAPSDNDPGKPDPHPDTQNDTKEPQGVDTSSLREKPGPEPTYETSPDKTLKEAEVPASAAEFSVPKDAEPSSTTQAASATKGRKPATDRDFAAAKQPDTALEETSAGATSLPESADAQAVESLIEEPKTDSQGAQVSPQEHEVREIHERSIPEEHMSGPKTISSMATETPKGLGDFKALEELKWDESKTEAPPLAAEVETGARALSGLEPRMASNPFSGDDSQDNVWEHIADEQEQGLKDAEASSASRGAEQKTEKSLMYMKPETHDAESKPATEESDEHITEQVRGLSLGVASAEQSKDKKPIAQTEERSELAPMDESSQDPSKTEDSVSISEYSQGPSTDKSLDHPSSDKGELFGDDSRDASNWERSIASEKEKSVKMSDDQALGLFGTDPAFGSGSDEAWTVDRAFDDDISKHFWSEEDPYRNMFDVAPGVQDLTIGDTSEGLSGLPRDTELDARSASGRTASTEFWKSSQGSERPAQPRGSPVAESSFQHLDEQASANASQHSHRDEPSVFSIPSATEGDENLSSARPDMHLPSVAMPAETEPESNNGAGPFWAPTFETSSSREIEPQDRNPKPANGANLSNDFSFDFDDEEPSRETRQSSGPDPLLLSALGVSTGNGGFSNSPFAMPTGPQEPQAGAASTGAMEAENLGDEKGQQAHEPGLPQEPASMLEDEQIEQTGGHAGDLLGEEPVGQADKSPLEPTKQPIEQLSEQRTERSVDKPAHPAEQAAEQSAERSTGQLDEPLVESYTEELAKEPVELPAERSAEQHAEQLAGQLAGQPAEKPEPEQTGEPKDEEEEQAVKAPGEPTAAGLNGQPGPSDPAVEPPKGEEMTVVKQPDEEHQCTSVQPPSITPSMAEQAPGTGRCAESRPPTGPDSQAKQAPTLPERRSQQASPATTLPATTPPATTRPVMTPRSQTPSAAEPEVTKSPSVSTSPRPPTFSPRSAGKPRQDSLAQPPPAPPRLYPNPLLSVGSARSRSGTFSPSQQSTPDRSTSSRPGQSRSSPFSNIPPSRSVPRWLLDDDEAPRQPRTPSGQMRSPAADRSSVGAFSPSFYRSMPSFPGASPRTEHCGPGASSPDVSRSTNRSFDVSQTSQTSGTSETQRKRLSDIMREADEILQEWS